MLRFFLFSVIHNYIMALFQQSVIKKYISDLNKEDVQKAWALFQSHFHNAAIQENIRDAKEEEYQEGFVRDIFVNILGYTLKPQPHYNFVLEKKTETDATKSDGALLRDDNIIGVVCIVLKLVDFFSRYPQRDKMAVFYFLSLVVHLCFIS